MALINSRDITATAGELQSWLAEQLPQVDDVAITDVAMPPSSGMSNETLLFTASWRHDGEQCQAEWVARIQPPAADGGVFPSYDLEVQHEVTRALADRTTIPVARSIFREERSSVLGAPFLVMERKHGRVPSDDPPFTTGGWVVEAGADGAERVSDGFLAAVGAIHDVDWRDVGLGWLEHRGANSDGRDVHAHRLEDQLTTYERFYAELSERTPSPTAEAGLEWLGSNLPSDPGDPVLCWGDARVGNTMYADDLSVAAVLDWELVSLGWPEQDLGWSNFMMRHHTDGIGAPVPAGFPAHDEVAARYQQVTGRAAGDLHFWEVLAGVKITIIGMRVGHMLGDIGVMPPEFAVANPASFLVASLAGLPAPDSESTTFFGKGVR